MARAAIEVAAMSDEKLWKLLGGRLHRLDAYLAYAGSRDAKSDLQAALAAARELRDRGTQLHLL